MKKLIIFITSIIVLFSASCKKADNHLINKELIISKIQHWYSTKDELKNEHNPFSSMRPLWNSAYKISKDSIIIYEFLLSNPRQIIQSVKLINDEKLEEIEKNNEIKFLVFIDSKTMNIKYGVYMSIIDEIGNTSVDKMHYSVIEERFSGRISYYNILGNFENGWRYINGQVVSKSIAPIKSTTNYSSIQEKTGERLAYIAPVPPGCDEELFPVYGQWCVEAGIPTVQNKSERSMNFERCETYIIRTTQVITCPDGTPGGEYNPGSGGNNGNPDSPQGPNAVHPTAQELDALIPEVDQNDPKKVTNLQKLLDCFNDNKTASSYKLTLYIDQPFAGSAAPARISTPYSTGQRFTGSNGIALDVGHAFVGFEKINTDGSTVRQVLGFYPGGSPLVSNGMIKNDEGHSYDVSYTITVSSSQFNTALYDLNETFNGGQYNLRYNNCTDEAKGWMNSAGANLSNVSNAVFRNNPGSYGQYIGSLSTSNSTGGNAPSSTGPCN